MPDWLTSTLNAAAAKVGEPSTDQRLGSRPLRMDPENFRSEAETNPNLAFAEVVVTDSKYTCITPTIKTKGKGQSEK